MILPLEELEVYASPAYTPYHDAPWKYSLWRILLGQSNTINSLGLGNYCTKVATRHVGLPDPHHPTQTSQVFLEQPTRIHVYSN